MKVAIVGFGLEGKAAYNYFKNKAEITICDQNQVDVPEGVHAQLGTNYLADLSRFDIIVRSPVIKPSDLLEANDTIREKVTSNTNEFFKACPSSNIVGVTGTKGKGTTSTLIAKMIEAGGRRVHLGGNIGVPALELLNQDIRADDWVVLELSSFQLVDCQYSPAIGVCLMVVAEHLDWHPEIDDYFNAKTQLFRHQGSDDVAVYFAENENSVRIASTSKGWKIPYFEEPGAVIKNGYVHIAGTDICPVEEIKLRGRHNLQNVCAAVTALWQINRDPVPIRQVLNSFTGLEHRLEYAGNINGAAYYDDSFGTTPETAMVAIESFVEPKIVILGGSDKGADYTELAKTVAASNVRKALLIGDQGPRIEQALRENGFNDCVNGGISMGEIITSAKTYAQPGDVVLLSPACASFDMFDNYKDRGNQFKQAVSESQSGD